MHTDKAIAQGISDMKALGSDELLLVPCTADINELDAIENILA